MSNFVLARSTVLEDYIRTEREKQTNLLSLIENLKKTDNLIIKWTKHHGLSRFDALRILDDAAVNRLEITFPKSNSVATLERRADGEPMFSYVQGPMCPDQSYTNVLWDEIGWRKTYSPHSSIPCLISTFVSLYMKAWRAHRAQVVKKLRNELTKEQLEEWKSHKALKRTNAMINLAMQASKVKNAAESFQHRISELSTLEQVHSIICTINYETMRLTDMLKKNEKILKQEFVPTAIKTINKNLAMSQEPKEQSANKEK